MSSKKEGNKTSAQTLAAAIPPLIARGGGEAPESRSKVSLRLFPGRRRALFKNFAASKLREKKTCADPFEWIL